MQKIYSQFRDDHPFVQVIKQCLGSFPKNRPSIHQVVLLLERARGEIDDAECHMDRLMLVQMVKEQNQQIESLQLKNLSKNQRIGALHVEMQSKEQELLEMNDNIVSVEGTNTQLVQQNHHLTEENYQLTQENQSQRVEIEQLRRQVSVSNCTLVCLYE